MIGRRADLVCVVAEQNRGWILDRIGTEVASRWGGNALVHYSGGPLPLPRARRYLFTHFSLFLKAAPPRGSRSYVFYTHPSQPTDLTPEQVVAGLSRAAGIVSMSTVHADSLVSAGVPAELVSVCVPGADPDAFAPHRRGSGMVGFCSAYYDRKDPGLLVEIVRAVPSRPCVLVGRGWEGWDRFGELTRLPNLEYVECAYEEYPAWYGKMDVFVSPSRLEGGPIPLLEAMMSNVVPVASRTGFAPDLVSDGANGFLLDPGATAADYADRIERAYGLDTDVRATALPYTWDAFAACVREVLS